MKQSTARNRVVLLVDTADHITGKIGLTLTIRASKNGAAFATITPTVTELEAGFYNLALTTAHTDTLGDFALHITSSGADPSDVVDQVVVDLPGATVSSVTGNVGGNVTGSVGSVVAGVTVTTNNDKTGYALSSLGIQAIWDALTSALTTVGSIGKLLVDNINATISSRSSHSAADVWAVATRVLTAGTNIVLAKGVGVTGFNDLSTAQVNAEVDTALSDYDGPTHTELVSEIDDVQADIAALSIPSASAVADAVWDEARAGHVGAGTFGEGIASVQGNVTGSVGSVTAGVSLTVSERNAVADAYLDRTSAIETGVTPRGAQRLSLAALAGKISGAATTTVTIRNAVADSKDRIVATVDSNGNRTAVSTDQT